MQKITISGVLVFALLLGACEPKTNTKARSIGSTAEILVVTDNKAQWDGKIGDAIRGQFSAVQYGLNQSEPVFNTSNIISSNLSKMFRKHRNLLVVHINKELDEASIKTQTDNWSKPQLIVQINAPDQKQWIETFNRSASQLINEYKKMEYERINNVFRPTMNTDAVEEVREKFGFTLNIPKGFFVAKNETDFMWIRKEVSKYSQGLIIYSFPYQDTADFSDKAIIGRRDFMVQNIPGPSEGSFMTTDNKFIPPQLLRTHAFVTGFATETRGIWKLENDFMGGPFLSYTFLNPQGDRIITAEGYVYAPNQDKRNLLLQMEALLNSISFDEQP